MNANVEAEIKLFIRDGKDKKDAWRIARQELGRP